MNTKYLYFAWFVILCMMPCVMGILGIEFPVLFIFMGVHIVAYFIWVTHLFVRFNFSFNILFFLLTASTIVIYVLYYKHYRSHTFIIFFFSTFIDTVLYSISNLYDLKYYFLPQIHTLVIKKYKFVNEELVASDGTRYQTDNLLCVICQDSYKSGDNILMLLCLHFYHKKCIGSWFRSNNTCPVCRRGANPDPDTVAVSVLNPDQIPVHAEINDNGSITNYFITVPIEENYVLEDSA